ncbi:MAG: PEP-CTERM sorting domain-containing protein [Armatimonas sp.]
MRSKLFLVGALLMLAGTANAQNLFANPDFEDGNTGFTSQYTFGGSGDLISAGYYNVNTNPFPYNGNWTAIGDHTTGSTNMMIVNGSNVPNISVWAQTVSGLTPNTDYYFSGWLASVYPSNPASLQFAVNGGSIGGTFNASSTVGQWVQWTAAWNSGSNTSAIFSIVNQNTQFAGNDFALDDLSLTPTNPGGNNITAPEPGSLALLGVPMFVFLRKRRK